MSIQRCYAVILFTDLCSSTSLCENIDAEFYAEIIAQIRSITESVIGQNSGLLNQFHGDGILATFGFPTPREDAIYQATTAALQLHQKVRTAHRHSKLPKHFELKMHSGIDAGYIIADTGDHIQGRYKFAGNALNTAARLSDLAGEDEIIVSVDTLRHELPFFITERFNNVKLKGKQKCISVYKVKGTATINSRFHAREQTGLTPFVGRSAELKSLTDSLVLSKKGRLQHVHIIGDAGVGKSRLVKQFLDSYHCSNCNIYQTFSAAGRPFLPVSQFLRHIFNIEVGTNPTHIRKKVVTRLKQLKLNYLGLREQLMSFLCLDGEAPMARHGYPAAFTEYLASILGALAKKKPTVLLIDDCYLANNQTLQNIAVISQRLQKSRILIITCTRSNIPRHLATNSETLLLKPLNPALGKKLIHHLLPQETSQEKIHSTFSFCSGNPLYIEETCQLILQNSIIPPPIDIEPNDKFLKTMHSNISPKILWLIIQWRQHLPRKLLETIDCAAIIGRHINKTHLEILCGHPLSEKDLQLLANNRLIYGCEKNKNQLVFSSGLTRAVIYETIHISKKNYLHEKYAQILKTLQGEAIQPSSWENTTRHLNKTEKKQQSARYFAIAAE